MYNRSTRNVIRGCTYKNKCIVITPKEVSKIYTHDIFTINVFDKTNYSISSHTLFMLIHLLRRQKCLK